MYVFATRFAPDTSPHTAHKLFPPFLLCCNSNSLLSAARDGDDTRAVLGALRCIEWLCLRVDGFKDRMVGPGASALLPLMCNLPIKYFTQPLKPEM